MKPRIVFSLLLCLIVYAALVFGSNNGLNQLLLQENQPNKKFQGVMVDVEMPTFLIDEEELSPNEKEFQGVMVDVDIPKFLYMAEELFHYSPIRTLIVEYLLPKRYQKFVLYPMLFSSASYAVRHKIYFYCWYTDAYVNMKLQPAIFESEHLEFISIFSSLWFNKKLFQLFLFLHANTYIDFFSEDFTLVLKKLSQPTITEESHELLPILEFYDNFSSIATMGCCIRNPTNDYEKHLWRLYKKFHQKIYQHQRLSHSCFWNHNYLVYIKEDGTIWSPLQQKKSSCSCLPGLPERLAEPVWSKKMSRIHTEFQVKVFCWKHIGVFSLMILHFILIGILAVTLSILPFLVLETLLWTSIVLLLYFRVMSTCIKPCRNRHIQRTVAWIKMVNSWVRKIQWKIWQWITEKLTDNRSTDYWKC